MLPLRLRYALVFTGFVVAEAVFAARPTGDLNGEVALFPYAAIWFAALLLSWGILMTGMFSGPKGREDRGPLMLGTVGAAVLIAMNF